MKRVSLRVRGAYAEMTGAPIEELEDCLAFLDPKRQYNQAYREDRWDGNIRLYDHRKFAAGLISHVAAHLDSVGYTVSLFQNHEKKELDLSRWTRDYLPGIEFWDNQYEAGLAMLQNPRGSIKSPTGSGKTELMCAVARYLWEERGWRTLVVVPKAGLLKQTAKRFNKYYDGDIRVGMFGDGIKEMGDIVVGTAQTLIGFKPRTRTYKQGKRRRRKVFPADKDIRRMLKKFEVLMLDECHHSSSETWEEIAMFSGAIRRYGLSGTPLKDDEVADMRMVGATGPLIYTCETQALIEQGLAARPKICMVGCEDIFGEYLPKQRKVFKDKLTHKLRSVERELGYTDAYNKGIVTNLKYNESVVRATEWLVDHGKRTLILCRRKAHWLLLSDLLEASGLDYRAVWGATDTEVRDEVKDLFEDDKLDVILASTIFDEGEDILGIEAIVFAEGVKASTNVIQRIGRGMRKKKTGANEVWIVDFAPTCHPRLLDHACKRVDAYEEEGHEVKIVDTWPEDDENLLPFLIWEDYE